MKIEIIFSFAALKDGLNSNFKDVEVNVVTCPDLRNEPFDLASEGKCLFSCKVML